MQITVINGTEKQGITYRLKEMFLADFREEAEIKEFYLPRDCPGFCIGCTRCILQGESSCKDAAHIEKIADALLKADLIIMASPAYVMHTTGAMKALLDHFAYLWLPHRPAKEMFGKRCVIISQCLGAGAKSTAKDIKDSISWWGVSEISVFTGKLMGNILWDKLSRKKQQELTRRIKKLAAKFKKIDYSQPAATGLAIKVKFLFCRKLLISLHKDDPKYLDGKYWEENGWLGKARPWKSQERLS
ncbi:MAG: NAD(P)H-dependent oxidoreductase [Bacillota bacterium]|nr:NAD(P)H-dependent oxidoreductase [Bacillota bacterium]